MLILKRKKNESIVIGNDIEIIVTEIKGDHIKLGIKAPDSISIFRKELYEAIQKENIAASSASLQLNFEELDNLNMALKSKVKPK
ncbi:MAG: hypothetical protein ACD_79C00963G0007 [uncultured bacterium]|nr:MAG: hypothetical protein ACD_79C00963G0007 [uncultured bacterium]